MNSKINNVVSVSFETSGFNKYSDNKAENYQILSFGLVVADAQEFKAIDAVYGEVKWDRKYIWTPGLESVHGFTQAHLDEHGMDEEQAAAVIADILFRNFGTDDPVVLMGHNIATFGQWFLKDILDKYDIDLFISVRMLDAFTLGKTLFGIDSSKELFEIIGGSGTMNALVKADTIRQYFRQTKVHWDSVHDQ